VFTDYKPLISLYQYQKTWIQDDSRFLAGMWARQTGKSFASSAKIVIDCREKAGNSWFAISSGERQVKDFMEKVKFHSLITGLVVDWNQKTYSYKLPSGEKDEYQVLSATYRNGSRIIALPANPDTVRGYSGNVYFDEFSVQKNSREMWAAVFPIISRGSYRLMITFTPKGKQNKAYEVWHNPLFTKQQVDIYQAVDQGCPHDIKILKDAIDDPDLWAQEYELAFLDEATAFLSYDLINSAEDDRAGIPGYAGNGGCFYVGMDIGRRRDLTVIWVVEQVGDVLWTREFIELSKVTFAAQDAELSRVVEKYSPYRICMDQSGMGEKMVEDAKIKYGARVEGVLFSAPVKLDLAGAVRRKFEDRTIRIPIDRKVRDDFHSVKKVVTSSGNIRFDAERSEDSHADRFWSMALAVHAAGNIYQPIEYESLESRRDLDDIYGLDDRRNLRDNNRFSSSRGAY
jgi:phage FluMu gp28-like protein